MRRIFAIWAVCLCWGILNAAPLGPFNATLLEQLKNDYQKGEKEVTRYIELQEKVANCIKLLLVIEGRIEVDFGVI